MLTIERFKEMLALQERLEVRIGGENWRQEGHDYKLCIHMECAEIIDHYGWKHWKDVDKEPDFDAIAMEVVDVWHFAMAFLLSHDKFDAEEVLAQIHEAVEEYEEGATIDQLCIGMGYALYAMDQFLLGNFVGLMHFVDMDFDDLYQLYIAKNVLNWFRQDNGYAEGTYKKDWNGREDNVCVKEMVDRLGTSLTAERLADACKYAYNNV